MSRQKGVLLSDDGRMELYQQGLNDCEIGKKMYLDPSSVWGWRKRRGLKPNCEPGFKQARRA